MNKKKMKKITRLLTLSFMVVAAFALFSSNIQARPSYQVQLRPLESCLSCHTNKGGGGPLNKFGQDWLGSGRQFKKIAQIDSDGDGYTNQQEINDKTLPGDPDSNPGKGPPYLLIVGAVLIVGIIAAIVWAKISKKQE